MSTTQKKPLDVPALPHDNVAANLPGSAGTVAPMPLSSQPVQLPRPFNSYWVIPGSLLAGEYPAKPSLPATRDKLAAYLLHGISAFLDLTESSEPLQPYEHVLRDLSRRSGIDCLYRRMPIRDVDVPSGPQAMRAILDQIKDWRLQQGRTVYVHCWGGVGRTGTVVGCHLVENGWTGKTALERLESLWLQMGKEKRQRKPQTPETRAQRDYVLNWGQHSG